MYYFSHDYGARNDPKLIKLFMSEGHAGKGIYWDIIEMLYEQGGYLLLSEIPTYAFELRTECDRIANVLRLYDLFENDGEKVWSESVLRRLKLREEKSMKAAKSALKRWDKATENQQVNANALRTHCEGNAIKERKGKERKGKEIKEIKEKEELCQVSKNLTAQKNNIEKREREFKESLFPYVEKYGKDMIRKFFDYWTEPNKSKTKMRFEMQNTWDTGRRLITWASREQNKSQQQQQHRPGMDLMDIEDIEILPL